MQNHKPHKAHQSRRHIVWQGDRNAGRPQGDAEHTGGRLARPRSICGLTVSTENGVRVPGGSTGRSRQSPSTLRCQN